MHPRLHLGRAIRGRSRQADPRQHRQIQQIVPHVGDLGIAEPDLLDLPVLARVGFSASPVDGAPEVRARVHWISPSNGGRGAARELVEFVLRAQGRWDAIVQQYSGA